MENNKQDKSKKTKNKNERSIDECINEVIENFARMLKDNNFLKCIPTGISKLDKTLSGGFKKDELALLASRIAVGKTSFAITCLLNTALDKYSRCALFSLEMPKEQVVQRMLCSLVDVSIEKAMEGTLSEKEWKKLSDATKTLEKMEIFVDDSAKLSAEDILSECRKLKEEHGLDFVVVDYLGLVSSKQKDSKKTAQETVAALKKMAKELDVAVLALAQTPRDGLPDFMNLNNENKPELKDLEKMGVNKKNCDVILFLYDKNTKDDDVELIIVKNGNERTIDLKFDKDCLKFKD